MSEAQRQAIEKHKLDIPQTLSKGQAMDLLTKLKFGQLGLWKKEYMAHVKAQKEEQRRQNAAELKRKRKGMAL
jgi:ATP-dependent helicase IRC3